MDFVVCTLLYPHHIHHRAALRLSSTCLSLRAAYDMVLEHIGLTKAKANLRRVDPEIERRCVLIPRLPPWLTVAAAAQAHRFAPSRELFVRDGRGNMYQVTAPPRDCVLAMIRTNLCRECFRPTRERARTSRDTPPVVCYVMLCDACGRDPRGYSSLISRQEALQTRLGEWAARRKVVLRVLDGLGVAKGGGNRARLYWRSPFLRSLRAECGPRAASQHAE